jgi:hypothetical protein
MILTHLLLTRLILGASVPTATSVAPVQAGASDLGGSFLNKQFNPTGLSQIYQLRERTN